MSIYTTPTLSVFQIFVRIPQHLMYTWYKCPLCAKKKKKKEKKKNRPSVFDRKLSIVTQYLNVHIIIYFMPICV